MGKSTGTKWAAISVLAHEIGHHLNGHTITASGSQPALELEADEFSGFVSRRMGAGLEDAQAAMKKLATVHASKTHPGQYDRLTSIVNGWNKADAQLSGRKFEPNSIPQTAVITAPPVVNTGSNTAERSGPLQVLTAAPLSEMFASMPILIPIIMLHRVTNLVRVKNNQLSVIGKLAQLNSRQYPYVIYDQDTQLLVDAYGNILTKQGEPVGKLSARRG